jgi:predicted dehydrogenase
MLFRSENVSRREFMARSVQVSAGITAASALTSCASTETVALGTGKVIGANDRINLAVIGMRSRGNSLIEGLGSQKNVKIAALCDIDQNVLQGRAGEVEKNFGNKPQMYSDMRKLFENKDIDAVAIATPNHWHALATIWACQAGKHVYVEKPACHNPFEGRKMVEAARKYDRLVQVGFQNRSITGVRQAMAFLKGGGIGDVYLARGLCYKTRTSIGSPIDGIGSGDAYKYYMFNKPGKNYNQAYMDKVDYDLWTGPAPKQPFNYNRFHYNWHWNWLYGNGDNGNQGPHQWDVARWGLGQDEHPVQVSSTGGFYGEPCSQNTPNTQTSQIVYADGKMIEFEVRGLPSNAEEGIGIGNIFLGTKGWMAVNGSDWQSYMGYKNEKGPGSSSENKEEAADPMNAAGAGGGGIFANFIGALRSNDYKKLSSDIESGYLSSALPLLSNIAYRTGEVLEWDGCKERFVGNSKANAMLTRNYRKPFVVPKNV